MMLLANLNSTTTHTSEMVDADVDLTCPPFVAPMLRNVHLSCDDNQHILVQEGDFWYWKLTDYGLDLMRLLVQSSSDAFSYIETFTEPEIENIPQLILLSRLNAGIHKALCHPESSPQWTSIPGLISYLQLKGTSIDLGLFEIGIENLIRKIKQGAYSSCGNRIYPRLPRK